MRGIEPMKGILKREIREYKKGREKKEKEQR